jgi:hypothetical protein
MVRFLFVTLVAGAVAVSAHESRGWDLDDILDIFKPKLTPTAYQKSIKLDGLLRHAKSLSGRVLHLYVLNGKY